MEERIDRVLLALEGVGPDVAAAYVRQEIIEGVGMVLLACAFVVVLVIVLRALWRYKAQGALEAMEALGGSFVVAAVIAMCGMAIVGGVKKIAAPQAYAAKEILHDVSAVIPFSGGN